MWHDKLGVLGIHVKSSILDEGVLVKTQVPLQVEGRLIPTTVVDPPMLFGVSIITYIVNHLQNFVIWLYDVSFWFEH